MILKCTCLYQFQTLRNLFEKLQQCLMGVPAWMTGSKLKLNPSKTEFLLIRTKLLREKFLHNFPCLILGQDTNTSASAKTFGVVFDSSLNFRKHISQTCSTCFYHIRDHGDLRQIRKKSVLRSCQANCSGNCQWQVRLLQLNFSQYARKGYC